MALRVNPGRPFHALIQSRLRALFPALQPAAWCPGAFSCPDAVFHANAEGKAWVRQQHRAGLLGGTVLRFYGTTASETLSFSPAICFY